MWAAWKGKAGVVEWLIASSAKLDRQEKWGRTALILAADEGHIEVVGAEDKTSDLYQSSGSVTLSYAQVRLLLQAGANPDILAV